jgi:hypothetical protein
MNSMIKFKKLFVIIIPFFFGTIYFFRIYLTKHSRLLSFHQTEKRKNYSSFDELGGWGKDFRDPPYPAGGSRERIVRLRNVCYSRSKNQFTLFMNPYRRRVPLMFSNADPVSKVLNNDCWVDLHPQAQAYEETHSCLRPEIVYDFIPKNVEWLPGVATLHSMRSSDDNIGHFLLDEMMNSFLQQWIWFNEAFSDNIMVFINTDINSLHWLEKLRPFWYDRQEIILSSYSSGNDFICFENLLAGAGAVRFHTFRAISSSVLTSQRDWIMSRAGFDAREPVEEHLIAFYVKNSGDRARSVRNAQDLISHLQRKFDLTDNHYNGMKIRFLHGSLWQNGFKSELELLSKCTVLITPPGGIAFSGLYLREGASMVLLDWWCTDTETGSGSSCRFAQETNVWSKFPDRYMRYYQVDKSELQGTDGSRWSANGVYELNPDKFVESVFDALEMADRRLNPKSW